MLLAGLSAFGLPFSAKYWHLIAFSFAYGLSDGVSTVTTCYIMLSCVDGKRITASFCINNMIYSFAAAAGGPIAGELVFSSIYSPWSVNVGTVFNLEMSCYIGVSNSILRAGL